MKLEALDQVHISAVSRDSIRAGQSFEVSDAAGEDLLKRNPTLFRKLGEDSTVSIPVRPVEPLTRNEQRAADKPPGIIGAKPEGEKSEAPPLNKAEPPHSDKAEHRRKNKGEK
jgi:hypothetical protein